MGVGAVLMFFGTAVGLIIWRARRTVDEKYPKKERPQSAPKYIPVTEESIEFIRRIRSDSKRE